ncbi:unnamed protein product, partial [Adineta steineri]
DHPTDVIVDEQSHSIIIADSLNRRVIQWMNQNQQVLIQNIDCYGLAMDKNGFLYVSDRVKNVVWRWKMGEYNEGVVVAGGNGKGNQLNQLYGPTFIFVDEYQSIYVSDSDNHRVMKWKKGSKNGTIVAGGNGEGRNLIQLSSPYGVIVDNLGQIYVADRGNDRIMRWNEGKGEVAVGGNGKENQLYGPRDLSFDDEKNFYVVDLGNNRIQKFQIIFNKQQQHNTNIPAIHVHNPVSNQQKRKIETSSAWSNREETQATFIGIMCHYSFSNLFTINYAMDNSNSTWNNISVTNSNQFHWEYSHNEQQPQTSTIPNDFPLYDPCNSNTGLNIPSSTILTHIQILQVNDVDEMDALDKEIEDFKK